jgi:hypothetical protein
MMPACVACAELGLGNLLDNHLLGVDHLATTANHTALTAGCASELAVGGKTAGVAELATFSANTCVKVFTVTRLICSGSLAATSNSTWHRYNLPVTSHMICD